MEAETPREATVRTVLALCRLRRPAIKHFMRLALEEMTDDQICRLLQKIGEWINENPPD